MTARHSVPAHPALDQYEILRELGRGGTAVVFLARERATGADVAIKLIRSQFVEDDEALARFAREARFVARLKHRNIVPVRAVLDLGKAGDAIVMARLAGRTLRQIIHQDGRMSPEVAERVIRDIARALDAAHATGIVHRDVKPENIFVENDGRAVLTDFGLARTMGADTQVTMHGVAIGTPAYMAPEQIERRQARRPHRRVQSRPRRMGDARGPSTVGRRDALRRSLPSEARPAARRARAARRRPRSARRRHHAGDREGARGALANHARDGASARQSVEETPARPPHTARDGNRPLHARGDAGAASRGGRASIVVGARARQADGSAGSAAPLGRGAAGSEA